MACRQPARCSTRQAVRAVSRVIAPRTLCRGGAAPDALAVAAAANSGEHAAHPLLRLAVCALVRLCDGARQALLVGWGHDRAWCMLSTDRSFPGTTHAHAHAQHSSAQRMRRGGAGCCTGSQGRAPNLRRRQDARLRVVVALPRQLARRAVAQPHVDGSKRLSLVHLIEAIQHLDKGSGRPGGVSPNSVSCKHMHVFCPRL